MNVQIHNRNNQMPYINSNGTKSRGGGQTPNSKASIDFSLSDKFKLLQLAERIQTTTIKHLKSPKQDTFLTPVTTTNPHPIKKATVTVFGNKPKDNSTNVKTSPRKSKLNASFKSTKKALKTDPARTNIEHLVNFKSPATTTPVISSFQGTDDIEESPTVSLRQASFHDRKKLANAFGPRKLFQPHVLANPVSPPVVPLRKNPIQTCKADVSTFAINISDERKKDNERIDLTDYLNEDCNGQVGHGVIIVDDLKNCQNFVELNRLSVNSVGGEPVKPSPVKFISTTCVRHDISNDISVNGNGEHVQYANSIAKCDLLTVSMGSKKPVLGSSEQKTSLSRKPRVSGNSGPNVQFSSHFYDNWDKNPGDETVTSGYGFKGYNDSDREPKSFHCTGVNGNVSNSHQTSVRVLPHTKTAQIIPLSRKGSFPPGVIMQETSTPLTTFRPAVPPPPVPPQKGSNAQLSKNDEMENDRNNCGNQQFHFTESRMNPMTPFTFVRSKSEILRPTAPPSPLATAATSAVTPSSVNPEDEPYVELKRSNSIPKTLRRGGNGRWGNVLPSLSRDELALERLELRRQSFFPAASVDILSPTLPEATSQMKLREQPGHNRPISLDVSQKKAWMRVYRDAEVSTVLAKSNGNVTKSITHLNHLEEKTKIKPLDPVFEANQKATLFQRFSKTFSLRFGSKKKVGSIPDLSSRIVSRTSEDIAKSQKGNAKIIRSDKCASGDSGIQLMEESPSTSRLPHRHSTSDLISSDAKMSLVEFPNDIWNCSQEGSSSTLSNEDLSEVNGKHHDDGFVSNDDDLDGELPKSQPENNHSSESSNSSSNSNYHSLPLKYCRQRKAELIEKHRMNQEPIRAKVIREIVTTEQSYVKTLHDIIQGFLLPCRANGVLFTEQVIANIFSNIEDLMKFHIKFLDCLMSSIDQDDWAQSNVGHVFNLWVGQFDLYSDYCCVNPMSMATVRTLSLNPLYEKFFEACRRLQLMDKLPLHGFLLRPIQRICQYHLQLNELMKHTDENHSDYQAVVSALNSMKMVATRVNDSQREFDRLQEIVKFQASIDGWEGPDLVNRNAMILQRGDLVKMVEGEKHREVFVAVLNRDVVVCKRDSFKKGGLNFNLRIDLESSVWVNIDSNEEDDCFGMVHNSWRLYNPAKASWILFTCSSPSDKRSWIHALQDTNTKFTFDAKIVEMAKLTTMQVMLAETQLNNATNNGTIVRNKKGRKSGTKLDADAMLIEVSKLKKIPPSAAGNCKFYV